MFEVEKKKIKTLFNETKSFVIPDFQRGFSWGVEEVEEFFEDLNNESLFFIGSFILKMTSESKNEKVEIIDGQQRTVTLALFYAALSYYLDKTIDKEDSEDAKIVAHELRKSIAEVDPGRPRNISKAKIDFKNAETNKLFAQIISEKNINNLPSNTDLSRKVKKVFSNILDLIEEETNLDYQKLITLKERIENTEVIIISIQKDELAYQIFETVNARGVDLTVAELLKNHLFKTISDHETLKKRWLEITDNLKQTQAKQLDLPTGLRFYWISNFEHTTKRRLYRSIKDAIKEGKIKENDLLDQIYDFSVDLYRVYDQDPNAWSKLFGGSSAERRQSGRWFFYKSDATRVFYKSIQYLPVFTSLLKQKKIFDITSSSFKRLLHVIESINFIYLEVLNLPGNVLEKKYSEYSRKISKSKNKEEITKNIAKLHDELKSLIDKQKNSKEEICKYILNLRFTNKRDKGIIMFILSRIEYLKCDFGVTINSSNVSLEHIYSQSDIGSDQKINEETAHSIGNLTLMEFSGPNGNGSLNNKPFEEKKSAYKESSYSLTRDICNYKKWTAKSIDERGKKIVDMVWRIWGPDQEIKNFGL